MDNLFLLLMFASLAAFITALVKPLTFQKIFKDKATRKNLSIYFIGSTIILFILFGITTDPVKQITKIDTPTKVNQKENDKEVINEQKTTNNTTVPNEVDIINQIDKKQTQIETNEQSKDNKTEILSTSDEENIGVLEEIKPIISVDANQASIPTKIENKPLSVPSETVSQKNAVRSAKSYLGYSAFSHDGLVAQLEYDQFLYTDAVYGVDNSGANWNEQAAKSVKSYMEYSAFSRGSLIDQLKYDKFTQTQAEYGVDSVGL